MRTPLYLLLVTLLSFDTLNAEQFFANASNSLRGGKYADDANVASFNVRSSRSSPRKSLIRFDLSSATVADGQSGTFVLFISALVELIDHPGAAVDVNVFALSPAFVPAEGILGYDWDPAVTTWNNAPANALDTDVGFGPDMIQIGVITVADLARQAPSFPSKSRTSVSGFRSTQHHAGNRLCRGGSGIHEVRVA